MAQNIYIPKLSETMAEGLLVEWKVKEGEWVEEKQVLVVIETDKVTFELEARASGFLHILAEAGSALPVGEVAGLLAETKEELEKLQKERPTTGKKTEEEAEVVGATEARPMPEKRKQVKISPVARKMAKENKIDINRISGSGPGGRIVRADIEKAIEKKEPEAAPSPGLYEGKRVKDTIPFTGMRKAIAEHMHRSLSVSAQLTRMGEIDMAEMVRRRDIFLEKEKTIGVRVSYTDLFVFVLAMALKDHPIINSSLIDDEIKVWEDINIGVAVALEEGGYEGGLIVPVVKNAEKKSLVEVSTTVRELTKKARSRKLMPEDVSGGTFTLTNVGVFGSGWSLSTPIINQPQSAILQTGAIVEKPVAMKGRVVIRPVMSCSLTYDHRVLDGAPAARFMERVRELMENPDLLLL